MEKTRYFRSINRFNVLIDALAGNFLPLDEKDNIGALQYVWLVIVWSTRILFLITVALGNLHFAKLSVEDSLKKVGSLTMGSFEYIILAAYLNIYRGKLKELVKKYNDLLIDSDLLNEYITDTSSIYNTGLKFYLISGLVAAFFYAGSPIFKVFSSDKFSYSDFTVPAWLPGEPFDRYVFIAGIILQISGFYVIVFGIVSVHVYVVHCIVVLAGQYKFARWQMLQAFSAEDGSKSELMMSDAVNKSIDYHAGVINLGSRLVKILHLYVGVTYITCIMQFCFLSFGIITFESAILEKIAFISYIIGRAALVLIICSTVEELLDASTGVWDDAFHETWYVRSKKFQKTCYTIQLGSKIECRVTAWRVVDLLVPTLTNILSKSYSVCLLLLNVK